MRRLFLFALLLVVLTPSPAYAPDCVEPTIFFKNARNYVTQVPLANGDTMPLRAIATADLWVCHPAGVAAGGFNFTIDYHLGDRLDIREWMTQHIWPSALPPGRNVRIGIWQQRTFPGRNTIDVHTNIVQIGEDRDAPDLLLWWWGE